MADFLRSKCCEGRNPHVRYRTISDDLQVKYIFTDNYFDNYRGSKEVKLFYIKHKRPYFPHHGSKSRPEKFQLISGTCWQSSCHRASEESVWESCCPGGSPRPKAFEPWNTVRIYAEI